MSERRKYHRSILNLPLQVRSHACENGVFFEQSETFNVSPLGLSCRLRSRVEEDDILQLTLPMPNEMRLFDFDQPQYAIYAQVRRVKLRADGYLLVGVAFISKDPPDIDMFHPVDTDESAIPSDAPAESRQQFATRPMDPQILAAVNAELKKAPPEKQSPKRADTGVGLKHPTIAQRNSLNNDRGEPRAKLRLNLSIRGLDRAGQYFVEVIQTEDVSKHGLCFALSKHEIEANTIIEIVGFQGKFNAQGEVRHCHFSPTTRTYRIGIRLLGEPLNWIVK